jgi:hypothetical protein
MNYSTNNLVMHLWCGHQTLKALDKVLSLIKIKINIKNEIYCYNIVITNHSWNFVIIDYQVNGDKRLLISHHWQLLVFKN